MVSGTVPEDLNGARPLALDWSLTDLKSKDQSKWPPSNTALSDLVVYNIIAAEVSYRERQRRWPAVFQSLGHISADRQDMGPTINQAGPDGVLRDMIYRKGYILHGDLGAQRKGGNTAQRTDDRSATIVEKGKSYLWSLSTTTSCYQSTTSKDRFLPDVIAIASANQGRVGITLKYYWWTTSPCFFMAKKTRGKKSTIECIAS